MKMTPFLGGVISTKIQTLDKAQQNEKLFGETMCRFHD